MKKTALLIGQPADPHIRLAAAAFAQRGYAVEVFNHYTDEIAIEASSEKAVRWPWLELLARSDIAVVWARVKPPADPTYADVATHRERFRFWSAEWRSCLQSTLQIIKRTLPHVHIVNAGADPVEVHLKPLQLSVARDLGLLIPTTVIGNSFSHISTAFNDRVLYKPLSPGAYDERGCPPVATFDYAEVLANEVVIKAVPGIFQAEIVKAHELRVHVFGETIISAQIDSQESELTKLDWRMWAHKTGMHRIVEIGDDVCVKLKSFMKASKTWMAQKRHLHSGAQLVGRTFSLVDPFEIIWRQRVAARHLSVGDRRLEQPSPFVTREQASPRHGMVPAASAAAHNSRNERR